MSNKIDSDYNEQFMLKAIEAATLSDCNRIKVGGVLVKDNTIIASACNSLANGDTGTCEKEYYVCSYCKSEFEDNEVAEYHVNNYCAVISEKISTDVRKYNTHPTNERLLPLLEKPNINKETHGDDNAIVHAEINIIAHCAKNGISMDKSILYVTVAPCINCANAVIQAGVQKIFYMYDYKSSNGANKLLHCNIPLIRNIPKSIYRHKSPWELKDGK